MFAKLYLTRQSVQYTKYFDPKPRSSRYLTRQSVQDTKYFAPEPRSSWYLIPGQSQRLVL